MPRDVLPTELVLTPEPSPVKLILNCISILLKKGYYSMKTYAEYRYLVSLGRPAYCFPQNN